MLPFTHPDNLAKAVKKLEVVHLEGVNLTVEQLEEVMEEVLDQHSNTEVLDLSYNGELDKVGKELKSKVERSEVEAYLHINPPPPAPPAPADAPAPPPAAAPAEEPAANLGLLQNLDLPELVPPPLGLVIPGPLLPPGPPGPPGPHGPPLVFQPVNALGALDELDAFPWGMPMDIN